MLIRNHLLALGNDNHAAEDLDEYFYGDPDDQEPSDARMLDREGEWRQKKYNEVYSVVKMVLSFEQRCLTIVC